jgi:hypothetical protein
MGVEVDHTRQTESLPPSRDVGIGERFDAISLWRRRGR